VPTKHPQQAASERRAWQRMLSGRRLDLLDPSPLDIEIEDIAHGLARVARWNGQTTGDHPFSVAQHSIVVVAIVGELKADIGAAGRLAALLHDAAEYVIGDMITPFKAVIGDEYAGVEERLARAIRRRFGLPARLPEAIAAAIKAADRIAAYHEATRLAGFGRAEALKFFGQPGVAADRLALDPWPTATAEERFRSQFDVFSAALSREAG
jgi:5'-deoxynucleotidase YfbR-like HD superfamily hydrolase